jgi:serine/threonine-protein kinase
VEIERIICEQELLPPSAAFDESEAMSAARIAARRGSSTQELSQRLRGDLDAIVLGAMRREPLDRYASAALLGKDIEHHLDGEPIAAVGVGGGLRGLKLWAQRIGRALRLV